MNSHGSVFFFEVFLFLLHVLYLIVAVLDHELQVGDFLCVACVFLFELGAVLPEFLALLLLCLELGNELLLDLVEELLVLLFGLLEDLLELLFVELHVGERLAESVVEFLVFLLVVRLHHFDGLVVLLLDVYDVLLVLLLQLDLFLLQDVVLLVQLQQLLRVLVVHFLQLGVVSFIKN